MRRTLATTLTAVLVILLGPSTARPEAVQPLRVSPDRRHLVEAMAWVTMPALVGPIIGPPVGGFITTYASWHWIFLINVPIGLIGIVLALRTIENVRVDGLERFDFAGMVLSGLGVAGLAFGLSVAGLGILPGWIVVALVAGGAVAMTAYVMHSRGVPAPVLDFSLVRLPTFRANVLGGSLFRMGIGALSFLLPLMLQLGFHLSPLQSGLITFTAAVGAFAMKAFAARIIRQVGFRKLLIVNGLLSSAFTACCAFFTPATPYALMIGVLLIGGFFRSLQFTATNTIAYADVAPQRMSRATACCSASATRRPASSRARPRSPTWRGIRAPRAMSQPGWRSTSLPTRRPVRWWIGWPPCSRAPTAT